MVHEEIRPPAEAVYDPYHSFISAVPYMVEVARYAAQNESISYRKFHVGAALFAVQLETAHAAIISGGNSKPARDAPKYCAEMSVIDQAEELAFDHAIGMVIAGTNDVEKILQVTGRATPTLHSCSACRQKMESSKLITADTLIITVALEDDIAQVHTYDEMKAIYELEDAEGLDYMTPEYNLDLQDWQKRQNIYNYLATKSDNLLDPPALAKLALASTVDLRA